MTVIEFRKKIEKEPDFNSLLKIAVDLRKKCSSNTNKTVINNPKELISGRIFAILFEKKMIDYGLFMCGLYVADTLNRLITKEPESWYAIDYFLKGFEESKPETLKQGANTCFLICAIFKARGNRRSMKVSDYQKMGVGLYLQYYHQTGKEVGYHMGKNFPVMADVTEKCIKTL